MGENRSHVLNGDIRCNRGICDIPRKSINGLCFGLTNLSHIRRQAILKHGEVVERAAVVLGRNVPELLRKAAARQRKLDVRMWK